MNKKAFLYIDDIIWTFRDLTRQRPKSMFDLPFLAMLKEAHEKYGMKVQLNVFYRMDAYYGNDEFTLKEVTDAYKNEWESASDWLKLGFHSKQEFPDYPYVNADYEQVKSDLDTIKGEIIRFAGEKSFATAVVPHWMPISKDGCRALRDGGIKLICVSTGETRPFNGDPASLPYGHYARLIFNRKPETVVYYRNTLDKAINNSLCAYNHVPDIGNTLRTTDVIKNEELGIYFKKFCNGPVLNLSKKENLIEELQPALSGEYMCAATHEQYFYPEYFSYQPDYADKLYMYCEQAQKNGFEFIHVQELVD